MGVGDHQVQVAVVVQVGELPAGAAEGPQPGVEPRVGLEPQPAAIDEEPDPFLGEYQQIPIAVLVEVGGGGAQRALGVESRGRRVEEMVLPDAVVDPEDRRAAVAGEDRQVDVAIVVEIVVDDRRDGRLGQQQAEFLGHVGKRTVAAVDVNAAGGRLQFARRRHRSAAEPHRQQIQVAVAVEVDESRARGQRVVAGDFRRAARLETPLSVVQQQGVGACASQPEIHVAVVVHVADAGRDARLGKGRSRQEVAAAVVEPDRGSASFAAGGEDQVQIAVGVDVGRSDSRQAHRAAGPFPGDGLRRSRLVRARGFAQRLGLGREDDRRAAASGQAMGRLSAPSAT